MNKDELIVEELAEVMSAEESLANEQPSELETLKSELEKAQLTAQLLLGGVAKERLGEALAFAEKFCETGKEPAEAAAAALTEYPHLRTVTRELPKMAAPSSGAVDGFAEIRRIFSGALR